MKYIEILIGIGLAKFDGERIYIFNDEIKVGKYILRLNLKDLPLGGKVIALEIKEE